MCMKINILLFILCICMLTVQIQRPLIAQVLPVTCTPYNYNLKVGMRGGDVIRLQHMLIAQGFLGNGLATGYFGSLTLRGVKQFQFEHRVPTTGFVGPVTRSILYNLGCTTNPIPPVQKQAPTISSVSPSYGPVGTTVTIYGTNFSKTTGNSINFAHAKNVRTGIISSDGNTLVFTIPATPCSLGYMCAQVVLQPGNYGMSVNNGFGTSNSVNFQVTDASVNPNPGGSNPNPVIQSVEGPTSLAVGQQGSWTVRGSNSAGGNLSYSVLWGDETSQGNAAAFNDTYLQSTTFTHAYQRPGTYTARFTVRNNIGREVTSTITVVVAGNTTQNAPTLLSLSPTTGRFGNPILLTGTNFDRYNNIVNFGNITRAAIGIPSYDGQTLQFIPTGSTCSADAYVCTMQMLADGNYPITVTTPLGTTNAITYTISTNTTSSSQNQILALNQTAIVGSIRVTPVRIIEDSRCPANVTCIQSGRVVVATEIGSTYGYTTTSLSTGGQIFYTDDGYKVQIVDVSPMKISTSTIPNVDYRITYKIFR